MRHIFLTSILLTISSYACASTIEYSFANNWYALEKTSNAFTLKLPHFEKKIAVKKCNQKIFADLWKSIDDRKKKLQLVTVGSRIPAAANLKIDGVSRQVLQFEPGFEFFYYLHQDAKLAIAASEKKCAR